MNILEKVAYQNATKLAEQIDLAAIQVLNPPKWICEVDYKNKIVMQREWFFKLYCRLKKFEIHNCIDNGTYEFFINGKLRKILKID